MQPTLLSEVRSGRNSNSSELMVVLGSCKCSLLRSLWLILLKFELVQAVRIIFFISKNKEDSIIYKGAISLTSFLPFQCLFLAHLSRSLKGELIVYQSSCRLSVCVSVCLSICVSVNIFKLEYLRNQWADRNEFLSEPLLEWRKGCIRFWARSDRNSGVHGNG